MTPRVPYFVRRAWRLLEAKRALFEGAPERALVLLRDPALVLSPRADHLRERVMDVLFRSAAHKAQEGRDASVARILRVAAGEDPELASDWGRRFQSGRGSGRLKALLAQMREASAGSPAPRQVPAEVSRRAAAKREPSRSEAPSRPLRFHLAVDDGGEFLVVSGPAVTLGHARSGRADVPLLADLESIHARITWSESFHGGPSWRIEAVGGGSVSVDGRAIEEAWRLADGDEVRLSPNVSLRFHLPEPASASAVLELLRGVEADGARQILLLTPGTAGRVRIGPKSSRHVPVAGLEHEVLLTLESGELLVACEGGLRVFGPDGSLQEAALERSVPLPLERRVDVRANARPSQTPPFGLTLSPLLGLDHPSQETVT